nr:MAG TPA: hypothetical protein [Caudoviricetes sp.]
MHLAPDDFAEMTPVEFVYAWLGWSELEQFRTRQAWERERWAVWVATCIQLDKKDRQPMIEMFPLPWEATVPLQRELTSEERKERIQEMKACIKPQP